MSDEANEASDPPDGQRVAEVERSLDRLAQLDLDDREDAWR